MNTDPNIALVDLAYSFERLGEQLRQLAAIVAALAEQCAELEKRLPSVHGDPA
ncbi:hypothetical protein [Nocardia brasiliensis]|uniref:hypothetical protein n=1 Tax=Nocardia brasiliensis TaxID=37326 RepID=UPI0024554170|nr:hypothetical protein [Nocardia brasiliensis]